MSMISYVCLRTQIYINDNRDFIPLDEIWLTYGSWELARDLTQWLRVLAILHENMNLVLNNSIRDNSTVRNKDGILFHVSSEKRRRKSEWKDSSSICL